MRTLSLENPSQQLVTSPHCCFYRFFDPPVTQTRAESPIAREQGHRYRGAAKGSGTLAAPVPLPDRGVRAIFGPDNRNLCRSCNRPAGGCDARRRGENGPNFEGPTALAKLKQPFLRCAYECELGGNGMPPTMLAAVVVEQAGSPAYWALPGCKRPNVSRNTCEPTLPRTSQRAPRCGEKPLAALEFGPWS